MKTIFFVILISISSTGFSQCEVTKSKGESDNIMFESGVEKLFEDNLISVATYSAVSVSNRDKSKVKFMLVVLCAAPAGTNFIPRKLVITLENGSTVSLDAEEKLPTSFNNNRVYASCIYRVILDKVDLIVSYKVRSLEVLDHYTSKSIKGLPYDELLKNQFKCLIKSVDQL